MITWEEFLDALRLCYNCCTHVNVIPAPELEFGNATHPLDNGLLNTTPPSLNRLLNPAPRLDNELINLIHSLEIEFRNAAPEPDPVFSNAITDSAYVPRGRDPVVANVINDPVVANVINNSPFVGSESNSSGLIKPHGSAKLLSTPLKDFLT